MVKHSKKAKLNIMHMTVKFWGLFFRTGKIFFGLTRSSCLSVRMTDNFQQVSGSLKQTKYLNKTRHSNRPVCGYSCDHHHQQDYFVFVLPLYFNFLLSQMLLLVGFRFMVFNATFYNISIAVIGELTSFKECNINIHNIQWHSA